MLVAPEMRKAGAEKLIELRPYIVPYEDLAEQMYLAMWEKYLESIQTGYDNIYIGEIGPYGNMELVVGPYGNMELKRTDPVILDRWNGGRILCDGGRLF